MVHYRIHKSPPPQSVHILSHSNPVHAPYPTSLRSILILSSHLRLGLPSGLFPSGFPNKTPYAPLIFSIYATCPAHLNLLDLITQVICSEEYVSLSSSLCSFPHPPIISSLLCPNIPSEPCTQNTLSLHASINVSDQVSHPKKQEAKL